MCCQPIGKYVILDQHCICWWLLTEWRSQLILRTLPQIRVRQCNGKLLLAHTKGRSDWNMGEICRIDQVVGVTCKITARWVLDPRITFASLLACNTCPGTLNQGANHRNCAATNSDRLEMVSKWLAAHLRPGRDWPHCSVRSRHRHIFLSYKGSSTSWYRL